MLEFNNFRMVNEIELVSKSQESHDYQRFQGLMLIVQVHCSSSLLMFTRQIHSSGSLLRFTLRVHVHIDPAIDVHIDPKDSRSH
jgi:hypothetical protein